MDQIKGLTQLYEYFFRHLDQKYLDKIHDPDSHPRNVLVFHYGTEVFLVRGDTTQAGMMEFINLYMANKHKIKTTGDVCEDIFELVQSKTGFALKLVTDEKFQYFYCYTRALNHLAG